jgi:hypothetical protein
MRPQRTSTGRLMARCEVRGPRAESAARRLLPFLVLKKNQALLLLEVARIRPRRHGKALPAETAYYQMELIRLALSSVQSGSWRSGVPLPIPPLAQGLHELGPTEFGWSGEELLAYLAGVIDSDGSLRVEKRRAMRMIGPHYRINIRCAQVKPSRAVDLLAQTFGGRVGAKESTHPGHRPLASWSLHDGSAALAVEALLPYLRVKHREAQLLLELRALKTRGKDGITIWTHRTRGPRAIPMRKRCFTPEQNAEFERIFRAVQLLHRGVPAETGSDQTRAAVSGGVA